MGNSANTSRTKRHRILGLAAAASVTVLVAVVVAAVVVWLRQPESPKPPPTAGGPGTSTSTIPTTPGSKPRPEFQDASCPDVQMVSIPGTWESSPQMDPLNPTQFPIALLLNVTNPIRGGFDDGRLGVWTTPYTAQFHNPFSADGQMSYNDSRAEGKQRTVDFMTELNTRCPLTSYVIVGFSQGAVIAGDIASDIGNGRGPVDQDLVLGVTLIADGRRQEGVGKEVGPNPPGHGAEITLTDVPMLSTLGLAMTGPREGGFGALNDRTNEICAEGDLICAAPSEAFSIINLPQTLDTLIGAAGRPVHALYGTPDFWVLDGQTAPVWTANWARGLIENAPRPKHG
ncbi:carboxylesterase Culp6 [Mycolicibacterium arenosum]|uniref:Cutinase family protein n=1 Tax=Mycolicibacterium arenosum TaxID=2952157 RepID=A0ABT1M9F8_9MYCO|nr:cutinase family protein [Mycolicibacterium sp. CAU 1645]MCP9275816.1 cutinase family protein [Mycolicibacterium sp. CAU 1645]